MVICLGQALVSKGANYYFNAQDGNDTHSGRSPGEAWKTLRPLADIRLRPGDSLLFAAGQKFTGMLDLDAVAGKKGKPIVVTAFQLNGSPERPLLDAGNALYAVRIRNASFIELRHLEITANLPYTAGAAGKNDMRCGILVEITEEEDFRHIVLEDLRVHDVYYHPKGFKRSAAEIRTANGTQSYGWGIRFINQSKTGTLRQVKVAGTEIFHVSHTGLKFTANRGGISQVEVMQCRVHHTGGPGIQLSGVEEGHIHHNQVSYSGSTADSRNWARGSGLWTWSCTGILIEHNRFENANGPGDSAGVHIDFNCNDVVVQYNFSANNAGGFCEILGNNYNCAYRYNISVNDGYRIKGKDGAFQEGKIFWLSGYQGDNKPKAGPYNSYFYNNTIYVAENIVPRIAVSSSSSGILIANNLFYFESPAIKVAGDQKKSEVDSSSVPYVLFTNNLYLRAGSWPADLSLQDAAPVWGDPGFRQKAGFTAKDYIPGNKELVANRGIEIKKIPMDKVGLRIGLKVEMDILGNKVSGLPDIGAIELND